MSSNETTSGCDEQTRIGELEAGVSNLEDQLGELEVEVSEGQIMGLLISDLEDQLDELQLDYECLALELKATEAELEELRELTKSRPWLLGQFLRTLF